jgi:hypothetical protein
MLKIVLLTCSFNRDLELCDLLCMSLDHVGGDYDEHVIVVPRRDLTCFAYLAGGRRRLIAAEEVLPSWLVRAPMPPPVVRCRVRALRRDVWLSPFHGVVRGWITQQILKIAASLHVGADVLVHTDSDVFFVRPLRREALVTDGRVRLFRNPAMAAAPSHAPWHEAAARLFGLEPTGWFGADYIDHLVVWRRDVVEAMVERIETVAGRAWPRTLAGAPTFAEYILYGVFAERLAADADAKLAPIECSLSLSLWFDTLTDERATDAFVAALRSDHVAAAIQSTIGMTSARRAVLRQRLVDAAARADAGVSP